MGRLTGVTIDIEGVQTIVDFEVIKIVDENNPYPTFLVLYWAFDNKAIINLKKRQMVFEKDNMRVIVPLDPSKGVRYIEPIRDEYCVAYIENIYHITTKEEEWINPTADGKLS